MENLTREEVAAMEGMTLSEMDEMEAQQQDVVPEGMERAITTAD